jgi:mannitol operon transcriptional antiterminator
LRDAVGQVFQGLAVPEEEIGYLVMHFGAALERLNRKTARFRALIVCSSGIGSSKILASRIKKEIPEIESLRNVSLFDLGSIPKSEYDLIISTILLSGIASDYVLVNPLLTQEDIQKIRSYLAGLSRQLPPAGRIATSRSEHAVSQLHSLKASLDHVLGVLERFCFQKIPRAFDDVEAAVEEICRQLGQIGAITDWQKVSRQLLEREKLGGLGIPGTQLALFHSRSEYIREAFFGVFELQGSIPVRSMENHLIEVKTILILLGPKKLDKEGLEVLSEISSLFIEEEAIRLFSLGQSKEMHAYLAKKLQGHLQQKIRVEE